MYAIDTLPLISNVTGTGITYSWSANYKIDDVTIANPKVWPKDTTVPLHCYCNVKQLCNHRL